MFKFWKCGVPSEKSEKLKGERIQHTQWLSYRSYWDAHSDLLAAEKIGTEKDIKVIEERDAIGYKVDQTMKNVSDIIRQKRLSRSNRIDKLKTEKESECKSNDDSRQKIANWKTLIAIEEKKIKGKTANIKKIDRELEIVIRDRSHIEFGKRYYVLNKDLPSVTQNVSKDHILEVPVSTEADCLLTPD